MCFLDVMQILEEQFLNKSEIIKFHLKNIITYKNCDFIVLKMLILRSY